MGGVYVALGVPLYRSGERAGPQASLFSERRVMKSKVNIPVGVALFAVLVMGLIFLLPGGLLQAQSVDADCEENAGKTGYECEYAENGTGPVATFTATDPEGNPISWDLDETGGADHASFSISKDGVLSFNTSPDYEETGTDNMHEVTVRATDDAYIIDGIEGQATTKVVMVEVTNEEEPGRVALTVNGATGQPVLQPQMGVMLTAALSDDDMPTGTTTWQWYRGSTEIIGATNAAYTPVQADIDKELTAKAAYTDRKNPNDKDMAEATTMMAVRAAPSTNNAPVFPDEDLVTSGDQTRNRKVAENTPAGRNIGAPVRANDEGDVLAYSLSGDNAGLFDIDIATGQLKTKGKLNREADDGEQHTVTVTAVDPFGLNVPTTVIIEIENEDERPVINERDAKTMLMYPEPVGATVTATEPDPVLLWTYAAADHEDDANELGWELVGADRSKLVIDAADGMLKFVENPDFEKPADANKNNVYEVTVVVTDSDGLTDTLAVRVEVTNAEEDGVVTFTVGQPRAGVPLTAMLEDPDGDETGHEWQWMVADSSGATGTAIDGATAATFTPRDSDLTKFLSVEVKYTDGKGKDEVTQELETAVAESAAPRFYKTTDETEVATKFELELVENTAENKDTKMEGEIFVGHRTDDVETVLRYAVGGADAASFKVITDNGASTVKLQAQGPLDIEEKASYAVTVTATDSAGNSTTLPVTITVTSIDEMPVVSGSGADCEENAGKTGYECEYAENGTGPVATFTATDPEGNPISWDLDETGGADHASFSISKDGVLSFNTSPDYEETGTDNMHEVTVRATDDAYIIDGIEGQATTKVVMVEVTNEEEPGRVALTVNGATGQPVLQPQMGEELTTALSDGDTPLTDITWQWYRGSTEIIGATTSTYTPDESDIGSRLTAKATYMDGEDANNKKIAEGSTTRTVRRAPDSNNAPVFPDEDLGTPGDQKTPDRKVAENTPAGRNIGAPVRANDQGDVLAYSLSGDNAGLFDIDIATGQLKTKGKLNREADDGEQHTVTVTAVDPFGETDEATVTIEIENEDERPVINERDAKTMLMYPEPVGATVTATEPDPVLLWTYAAADHEDDANDVELGWELVGADRSKLVIDAADGMLKFVENPDFEKPADANKNNVYEVTVVVTDSDGLTDTLAVRVEVTNAEEDGVVTFTVGQPRAGVPLTAMLEDPDGDETGHEWQWMVADSSGATGTAIDGATAATFTPRDSDLAKFLSVEVKYTDGKGKDEATGQVGTPPIAVAASAAPRFYDSADAGNRKVVTKFELELVENTAENKDTKMEGEIFVVDRTDDVATVLRYAVGGADAASFKVITGPAGSGTVKLQAQGPLDIEEKASYAVTVTATDSDGNSATLPVTITVTPVDEMPVVTLSGLAISGISVAHYEENRVDSVGTYMANGPMAGRATLSLTGDDVGDFMLDRDGMLKFRSSPNYEMPMDADTDNTYKVTVKANDGTYMAIKNVTVMVTDVEELGTLFGNSRHSYMENGEDAVATYTPSGPDTATWSLEGTDKGYFTITGGMLKFRNSPNYEMPRSQALSDTNTNIYMVTVKAEAGGEMDEIMVMVTVGNVDELGTLSGDSSHNYMEKSDDAVGTYTADGSMADMATWSLSGADMGDFTITGGILNFRSAPDFEMPMGGSDNDSNTYMVTVKAEAGGEMATQDVTVTVTNVEEPGTVTLMPMAPSVDTEISADLTDPDNVTDGTVTWQWSKSMEMDGSFTNIDMATSMTYTPVADDADYYLKATASYTDGEGSGKMAYKMTESPVSLFEIHGPTSRSYMENGTDAVATYTASGPGADMATWTLEGDDAGDFTITGGMLRFMSSPNYEMPMGGSGNDSNTYMVTVKASDGTNTDTRAVTVMVTNVDELGTLSGNSSPSYMENSDAAVGTYAVSGGSMSDVANWSLMGDDMGDLSISSSGVLTFDATPNYEMPMDEGMDNIYEVTVMAEAGDEMDEIVVTVTVTNANDPGVVTLSPMDPSVDEEITADLVDEDNVIEGTVEWQWSKSEEMDEGYTEITGANSAMYTPVVADIGSYLKATASYTDGLGPEQPAMATTTSTVPAADPLLVKYDRDGDGIDRGDVIAAITRYLGGDEDVTRRDVIDLITLYLGS